MDAALTLEPGEAANTTWDGLRPVAANVPAECTPAGVAFLSCERGEAIEPGAFTFSAEAGTSLDCTETEGECGGCNPWPEGGCYTPGALIAGTRLTAETQVTLDASYGVGGTSDAGAKRAVEIVFTP